MKRLLLLLLFPLVCFAQNWSGIIANNRAVDWSGAGVNGGIPSASWTQSGTTIAAGASLATVNAALAACGVNHYVLLSAGSYTWAGSPTFPSNCELRGAGSNSTFVTITGTSSGYYWGSYAIGFVGGYTGGFEGSPPGQGGSQSCTGSVGPPPTYTGCTQLRQWTGTNGVTGTYTLGATVLNLASAPTGLTVGTMLHLSQTDDTSLPPNSSIGTITGQLQAGTNAPGYSREGAGLPNENNTAMHQMVKVTAINGSAVTVTPGIYADFYATGKTPVAYWWLNEITNAGISSMSITETGVVWAAVVFFQASNCWATNIAVIPHNGAFGGGNSTRHGFLFHFARNITVQNSWLNDMFGGGFGSTTSYGVGGIQSSAILFQNNILHNVESPLLTQEGESGNVYSYNYDPGVCTPPTGCTGLMLGHDVGTHFELLEGNIGPLSRMDTFHGNGMFWTFFRNRFTGTEQQTSTEPTLDLYAGSRYFNIIGNVLGTTGTATIYTCTASAAAGCDRFGTSIYRLGYGGENALTTQECESTGGATGTGCVAPDAQVLASIMRWGNYDTVNAAVRFVSSEVPTGIADHPNSVPATHTLPPSFYLNSKPAFVPTSKPWPLIGPDVTGGNISGVGGFANTNPAADCYAGTGGTVGNFNAAACYPSTAAPPTLIAPVMTPIPGGYIATVTNHDQTGLPSFPWATTPSNPTVTIMDNQPGATLCVTTDGVTTPAGSNGVCTAGTQFNPGQYPGTGFTQYAVPTSAIAAITVTSTTTIQAVATQSGFTTSPVTTGKYTIDPSCSPNTFNNSLTITPYTTTAASWSPTGGGTTTLTLNFVDLLAVGETFTLQGAIPNAFNGSFTITNVNTGANQIQYLQASNPGTITTQGYFHAVSGLDGTNGIGVNDGLAYIRLYYKTNVLADARGEIGGGNPQTPYSIIPPLGQAAQDGPGGSLTHSIIFKSQIPGVPLIQGGSATNQNWFYGVTSHAIGAANLVCGSASQVSFDPNYNGGLGGQLNGSAAPLTVTGPMTAYQLHPRGSHHVTAGYSAYFAVDFYNLSGANPNSTSGPLVMTLTFTGGPPAGTKFNWMGAGNKTTTPSTCSNTAIDTTSVNDALTQSTGGICNDTNTLAFVWGTREIQFVTCNGQTSCGSVVTPPGTYTLNITMSGTGCSAACNAAASTTWQIIVDPPSSPFGITLTKQAPTSFPAIPNQATYLSAINNFGKNFWICAQDNNASDTIRPNDVSSLLPVSSSSTLGSWFYDGVNAHFAADALRLNWAGDGPAGLQQNWSQCREDVAELYRDKNALASPVQQYMMFTQGYYQDYQNGGGLHGQAFDKMLITQLTTTPQSPFSSTNGSYLGVDYRDIGYSFRNYVHAVSLGLDAGFPVSAMSGTGATGPFTLTVTSNLFGTTPPTFWGVTGRSQPMVLSAFPIGALATAYNKSFVAATYTGTTATVTGLGANLPACSSGGTSCSPGVAQIAPSSTWNLNPKGATTTPMAAWMGYIEDHIISSLETECIQQDPQYVYQQFMSSVSMRELVEYYNLIDNTDPRIPPIIKACADYLYSQFQPEQVGAWHYTTESAFTRNNITSGGTCVAIEDQLIPPIFAWLYQYSGLTQYQQEGDYIFGLGATFTTGNGGTTGQAQLPGGCYQNQSMSGALGHGSGSIGKIWSQYFYWGPQLNYVAQRNPIVNIFPGSIGVYFQTQGTASTAQVVTISNPPNPSIPAAPVVIGTPTITGSNFTVSGTCGTIAVGSSCNSIKVVFNPTANVGAITAYNATLNIPVGAQTYQVPLYGTGVIGTLAPVTFNPPAGTYVGTQNVAITSTNVPTAASAKVCYDTAINTRPSSGNGVVTVPGIITGGGGTCSDGQSTSIPNGNQVTLNTGTTTFISSTATAPGWADAVPTNPQTTFTITAGGTTVTLAPASLAFGNQPINTTSGSQTATLTNTGTTVVNVTNVVVSAPFANSGGTCTGTSFTLAVGANCTITITFTPTTATTFNGSLTITDNATGSPHVTTLSGTGTNLPSDSLLPSSLAFPNTNTGTTSAVQNATLTNTGAVPVIVNTVTVSNNFSLATATSGTPCPGTVFTLAVGTACTIGVVFQPTSAIGYSGNLTVSDNAQGSPHAVVLSGTGTAPAITWTPTSFNYGNVLVGQFLNSTAIVLQNTGTGPLSISLGFTGTNPTQFAFSSNTCTSGTLAAGASCQVVVRFTPAAVASYTANLVETDNIQGISGTVTLSGSGFAAPVTPVAPAPWFILQNTKGKGRGKR